MYTILTDLLTRFCRKLIYMYDIHVLWWMSEIIDLTKHSIGNCKFMQHAIFCQYMCAHGFTDLLDTSCQ